jgi:Protein of unknown function (DUF664).
MDPNRAEWNQHHQELRRALKNAATLDEAKQLFFAVHAPLHVSTVYGSAGWNLAEALCEDLTEAEFRCIPAGAEHSIAWCLWHLARIEDATMNVLVADSAQVYRQDDWASRLHCPIDDTGNLIRPEEVISVSEKVAFADLLAYRSEVGRHTRAIVAGLTATDIQRKAPAERLQRLLSEGVVLPSTTGLLDYWGGLTAADLLLMPPTRHNLIHLNEMLSLKRKVRKALKK